MLVPMYFLIGIWGGSSRIYAAIKFFLYTLVGSLLMLVAILCLLLHASRRRGAARLRLRASTWRRRSCSSTGAAARSPGCSCAFALAFAIKVPMFPLHTWLPDAHVQAPTGGSVILAGVLLKMGPTASCASRIPLFPEAAQRLRAARSGVLAVDRHHLRRAGAPWCSRHEEAGRLLLGQPPGLRACSGSSRSTRRASGRACYQMVNHGISTGALFLLVGMIYERRHTRQIDDFGGLAKVMPVYAALLRHHHAVLDRAARHQRLRRRVHDPRGAQPSPGRHSSTRCHAPA